MMSSTRTPRTSAAICAMTGVGACTDIGSAHEHIKGAIVIELNTGGAHVQTGNGGSVHGKGDADAAAETTSAAFAAFLLPIELLFDNLQALWQTAAFDDLGITFFAFTESFGQGIFIALFEPVLAAQFQGIHTKLFGNLIDVALQGKKALGDTIAAESTRREAGWCRRFRPQSGYWDRDRAAGFLNRCCSAR